MTIAYSIRAETPSDADAVEAVHQDAFGGDEAIQRLVERLRRLAGPIPTLSLVVEDTSGAFLGHVMLSHSWLDAPDRLIDILVLSPLGVVTHAQRKGVGTALLSRAVKEAEKTSAPMVILEGNPAFYGPRGFEASKPLGIRSPSLRIPEAALQVVRLPTYSPDMVGTLVCREVWWELDCVGLR